LSVLLTYEKDMPIPKKVLLVVNPISGDEDKNELMEKVRILAHQTNFSLCEYLTDGTHDRAEITRLLEEFAPDRVLIAGGDGTINMIADIVREYPVTIGLLPAGSANGLARNLGLPDELDEALRIALGENVAAMDGMLLNGRLGLHLSDMGLNARLVKNYEEGSVRGKWGYAKEVIRTLTEHELFRVRIQTDTEEFETEATMVLLANATMYGTGVVINPHGDLCDGKFEVIVATRFDVIELAKIIAGSTELDPEVVRICSTTSAVVECLDGKGLFQVDGEFVGEVNRVRAHILPKMLTVAVPRVESGVGVL
jgi:diacylglycerol kinase (ATP)